MKYELTAYELSLINGAFTIIGALLGAIITYWFSRLITANTIRTNAITTLRQSFAPEFAYLKSFEGFTAGKEEIRDRLYSEYIRTHAVQLENFRFFIKAKHIDAYDKACEEYQELLHPGLTANLGPQEPSEVFIARIRTLLDFTK